MELDPTPFAFPRSGGRLLGDRLAAVYKDIVKFDEIVPTLAPALTYYKLERLQGETFGDFCHRKGPDDLRARAEPTAGTSR